MPSRWFLYTQLSLKSTPPHDVHSSTSAAKSGPLILACDAPNKLAIFHFLNMSCFLPFGALYLISSFWLVDSFFRKPTGVGLYLSCFAVSLIVSTWESSKRILMVLVSHYFITHVCMLGWFSHVWLFCNPMDCSPPGSFVHGILQARILKWFAMPSSPVSMIWVLFWKEDLISRHNSQHILYILAKCIWSHVNYEPFMIDKHLHFFSF